MKPLQEEEDIQKILDTARPFCIVPKVEDIDFYTSGYSNGKVRWLTNDPSKKKLGICANYHSGDMSIKNPRFVKSVCHELVHYNGILDHGPSFVQKLDWLYSKVLEVLWEKQS